VLVVGVTGGLGSGKSALASLLEARGARLLDADRVGRDVLRSGGAAREAVLARFGPEILGPDGEIDRGRLAALVFSDPAAVRDLNAITHPRIRAEIEASLDRARREGARILVLEAALLVEAGARDLVDLLVVVEAPREERIARLTARGGLSREEIERRMAVQADPEALRAAADIVVENDGDLDELDRRAALLWERIEDRAGRSERNA
jgi:dephospho-CoA kinase